MSSIVIAQAYSNTNFDCGNKNRDQEFNPHNDDLKSVIDIANIF